MKSSPHSKSEDIAWETIDPRPQLICARRIEEAVLGCYPATTSPFNFQLEVVRIYFISARM